jgi:hypothetical protein
MTTYKKNYIGKGTQHETLDLVKVTLKVEELLKYQHEYEGEQYISFEVAKMQQPDKFGRTHTAYVNTREETPDEEPKPKKRGRKPKKETAEA